MDFKNIIDRLPYDPPFLFVDGLNHIDEKGVEGNYTFRPDSDFYRGHFKDLPVTPGVILTECCAQIGLVCLGLYLLTESNTLILQEDVKIALSSSEMEFYLPIYPNEKVIVTSKKVYFRFHKLKCEVKMRNSMGELVCKGTLAGMMRLLSDG